MQTLPLLLRGREVVFNRFPIKANCLSEHSLKENASIKSYEENLKNKESGMEYWRSVKRGLPIGNANTCHWEAD